MALSADTRKKLDEVFGVTSKAPETQVTWGIPEVDLSRVSAFEEKTAGETTRTSAVEPTITEETAKYTPISFETKEPEVKWGVVTKDPFMIPPRTDFGGETTPQTTEVGMTDVGRAVVTGGGALAQEFIKDWAAVGQFIAAQSSPFGPLWGADTTEIDPNTFLSPLFSDPEKAKKWGNILFGTDQKFSLFSRDQEFWEGMGLGGVETGGVLTTLFVVADLLPGGQVVGIFESFAKASRTISTTDNLGTIERTLRTLNLGEDVVSEYAPRLVNLTDEVEVGRIIKDAVEDSVRRNAGLPPKIRLADDLKPGEEIIRTGRYFDSRPVESFPPKALVRNLTDTSKRALNEVPQELVTPQIRLLRSGEVLDPVNVVQTADGLTVVDGIERLSAAFRLNQPVDVVETIPSAARPKKLPGDSAVPPVRQTDSAKLPKSRALGASLSEMATRALRITREAFRPLEERIKQKEGAEQILNRIQMQDQIAWSRFQKTEDARHLQDMLGQVFEDDIITFMKRIGFDKFADIRLSIKDIGISRHGQFDFEQLIISLGTYALRNGNMKSQVMIHELWHSLSRYLPEDKLKLLEGEYTFALRKFRIENPWFNFLYKRAKNPNFGGAKFVNEDIVIGSGTKKIFDKLFKGKAEFIKTRAGNFKLKWSDETYRFKNIDEFFAEELTDRSFAKYVKPEAQKLIDKIKGLFWKVIDAFRAAFGKPRRGAVSDRIYEDFLNRKYGTKERDGPLGDGDSIVAKEGLPGEPEIPRARQMKTSREIPSLEKAAEQAGADTIPLMKEARKYKSAEEFVKAQGMPVYRASEGVFDATKIGEDGTYVSPSKQIATSFSDGGKRPVEDLFISPNAKVLEWENLPDIYKDFDGKDIYEVQKAAADFARKNGYDVIATEPKFEYKLGIEQQVINPDVIKTRTQLEDIWKQAKQQRPFTAPKQEKKKRTLTQRALSKTRSADEIAEVLRKGGMSPEEIKNYELPDGSKLSEVAEVHVAKNGATSAIIYKSDIDSIKKSFVSIPSTGKLPTWTERMKTKAGRAANVYEVNQVFFDRKGLKKQFYEPIRDKAERAASKQSEEFLRRFKDAGLFKRKGFFTPDRFKINKKEANRIGEYFLSRQGKGYDIKFSDLTQKEKQFVKVVDGIIKDTEKEFFLVAKQNGIDPSKIEDYAPIMAKAEYKEAADWGNDLRPLIGPKAEEFGKAKRPQFGSVFERKENVPVSVYETDIRKTFPVWMEGVTRFNNLGRLAPKMYALLKNDEILRLFDTDTIEITAKFLDDTLANGRPDTPAGRIVADALRYVRAAASVSGLSFAYSSVLKQPLTIIAAMFVDKVRPQFRSKFAKEIGIEVKDLASITERKGNLSIADLQRGWFRIGTGPLTETDRKVAEMLLKGFLDKEYKKTMKALNGRPLSKEMTERILIDAQDKLDLWMGGMTRSQLPWAFRGEAGRVINMFQLPLVSQLNGFIYHILKAQGYKGNIKATTEVMAAAITIAYTEQAITNLSLNWDSKEDMVRDVRNSLLGNLPLVSQLTFAITSDSDFQISPLTGNLSTLLHSLNKHMEDPSGKTLAEVGFDTAKVFGFPRALERMVEGTEVIMEGGVRDKNDELQAPVESTPEQIRAFLRGKYGALAAQDYIENAFGPKENRSWNVPQVEFLQNGDWARRMELVDEIGYDETLELVAEMGPGSQENFWRYIFAKENPDADKYELGEYLEEQGLDKDGKASKIQIEAHQRRVREIQGLETTASLTNDTRERLEEIFNR